MDNISDSVLSELEDLPETSSETDSIILDEEEVAQIIQEYVLENPRARDQRMKDAAEVWQSHQYVNQWIEE